jgi:LysR family hydrogen peroxide-inducible transcriptional activator
MHDEITGTVRIGIIETVGRWLLPLLLRQQQSVYPLLRLHVAGATTTSLAPSVADGTLHLALVNLPTSDPELNAVALFDEARVLAVSSDNPLAKRDHVNLEELADIDLMVAPQGTSFRDEIDAILRDRGIVLTPRAEVDSMGLLTAVVGSGDAAALMPASALPPKGRVTGVPVVGLAPRSVGLVSNRRVPPSATTRAVVSLVRSIVDVEVQRRTGLTVPDHGEVSAS